MTLWSFLLAAVGPLAMRVLSALGISVLTFVGVESVVDQLIAYVTGAWGGLPGDAALLLGLAGLGEGMGVVLGAITSRLAIWSAASASRWVVGG